MILDQLAHLDLYCGISERLARGLRFLRSSQAASLPCGRHTLDGEALLAIVQEYHTRPQADCRWEAHRRYCDVQYVAAGMERIGVTSAERVRELEPYDRERDVEFFAGQGDFFTLQAGMFAVLWPHEVHMPCVAVESSAAVRKIVLKLALEPRAAAAPAASLTRLACPPQVG